MNPAVAIVMGALFATAISPSPGSAEDRDVPLTVLGGDAEDVAEARVFLELRFAGDGRIERQTRQTAGGVVTLHFPTGLSGWRLSLTPTNAAADCVILASAGDLPSTETAFLLRHAAEHRENPLYPEALIVRLPPPARPEGKAKRLRPVADQDRERSWSAWCDRQLLICWHFLATARFVAPLSEVWRIGDSLPGFTLPPTEVLAVCPDPGLAWPTDILPWSYSWWNFGPDQEISGLAWPLGVQFPYLQGVRLPQEHWEPPPFAPFQEGASPRSQPLPKVRP